MSNETPTQTTNPAYDLAHHKQFVINAIGCVPALIRAGNLLGAHHEIERALNDLEAAMDLEDAINGKL